MDSDDVNIKGRINSLIYALERNDLDVVGCSAYSFEKNINMEKKKISIPMNKHDFNAHIYFDSPMIHPTVCIRRNVLLSINGYDENCKYSQDYDLWSRLFISKCKMGNIDKVGLYYRDSGNSEVKNKRRFLYTSKIRQRLIFDLNSNMSNEAIQLHCYICGDDIFESKYSSDIIFELFDVYNKILLNSSYFYFNKISINSI